MLDVVAFEALDIIVVVIAVVVVIIVVVVVAIVIVIVVVTVVVVIVVIVVVVVVGGIWNEWMGVKFDMYESVFRGSTEGERPRLIREKPEYISYFTTQPRETISPLCHFVL